MPRKARAAKVAFATLKCEVDGPPKPATRRPRSASRVGCSWGGACSSRHGLAFRFVQGGRDVAGQDGRVRPPRGGSRESDPTAQDTLGFLAGSGAPHPGR
jgi:hypothetical protein